MIRNSQGECGDVMNFDREGFYREVGLRVQAVRKRARMTQGEVATDLCMPRATYANVERGRQRVPVDVVWRLAVLFNVPIHKLLPEPIRDSGSTATLPGLAGTGPAYATAGAVKVSAE
jgi:DNA-binding XRE family transcriptional regulator